MTEQNATVSALQCWFLPHLQLLVQLHVTHRNSLLEASQRYPSSFFSVFHMAVSRQNNIKIVIQLFVICYSYMQFLINGFNFRYRS